MEVESKNIMYEHSAAKVRLLKEYISAYLGILSNASWIKEVFLYLTSKFLTQHKTIHMLQHEQV